MTQVKEFMSKDVVAIHFSATIREAFSIFDENSFRHIPVINEADQVVGMISDRDKRNFHLMMDMLTDQAYVKKFLDACVKDFMKRDIISVFTDTSLKEAAGILAENKIGALTVLENGKLVGILSYIDVLRACVAYL